MNIIYSYILVPNTYHHQQAVVYIPNNTKIPVHVDCGCECWMRSSRVEGKGELDIFWIIVSSPNLKLSEPQIILTRSTNSKRQRRNTEPNHDDNNIPSTRNGTIYEV